MSLDNRPAEKGLLAIAFLFASGVTVCILAIWKIVDILVWIAL